MIRKPGQFHVELRYKPALAEVNNVLEGHADGKLMLR
jgi:hypothetical protein